MVSPDACPTTAPMTDPMDDDMIPIADAADMIGVPVSTARGWALRGEFVGVAHRGPRGLLSVPRSEAVRVREERERTLEERLARWQPMTDRRQVHGHAHDDGEGQHT